MMIGNISIIFKYFILCLLLVLSYFMLMLILLFVFSQSFFWIDFFGIIPFSPALLLQIFLHISLIIVVSPENLNSLFNLKPKIYQCLNHLLKQYEGIKLLDYFLFLPSVYAVVVIFYFFFVFLNHRRHYFIESCSLRFTHVSTILICLSLLAMQIFHLGAHASV